MQVTLFNSNTKFNNLNNQKRNGFSSYNLGNPINSVHFGKKLSNEAREVVRGILNIARQEQPIVYKAIDLSNQLDKLTPGILKEIHETKQNGPIYYVLFNRFYTEKNHVLKQISEKILEKAARLFGTKEISQLST